MSNEHHRRHNPHIPIFFNSAGQIPRVWLDFPENSSGDIVPRYRGIFEQEPVDRQTSFEATLLGPNLYYFKFLTNNRLGDYIIPTKIEVWPIRQDNYIVQFFASADNEDSLQATASFVLDSDTGIVIPNGGTIIVMKTEEGISVGGRDEKTSQISSFSSDKFFQFGDRLVRFVQREGEGGQRLCGFDIVAGGSTYRFKGGLVEISIPLIFEITIPNPELDIVSIIQEKLKSSSNILEVVAFYHRYLKANLRTATADEKREIDAI